MAWPTKNLGDVCNIIGGGTPSKSRQDFYSGSIPWATVRDMKTELLTSTECSITSEAVKSSSTNVIPEGNVIIATRVGLGKVCILRQETAINQDLRGVVPKNTKTLDEGFLFCWLKSVAATIVAEGTGATVQGVKLPFVKSLQVPLPPLPEQKCIVAILDEAFAGIDAAVANTEKNLANARELFESYLNGVFTRKGDGWVEKKLGDICKFSSGGTPSKKNSSYWNGEIPWVSGRDMKTTQLFDSHLHVSQTAVDASATRLAPAGTLLVLVRGMGLAHGAQVAELMVPSAFNQDIKGIYPAPDIISRYLVFSLRHQINSSGNVLSKAAHGTLKINTDSMKNIKIILPPRDQQNQFVEKINCLKEKVQHLESIYQQKLTALTELKQSILQKAFAGEL